MSDDDDPTKRMIKYHLGPDFLYLQTVGLTMNFSIGEKPINNLEMVERHYFRGKVIRDYSFKFGFVIPNSTNSWEFVYDLPPLTEEEASQPQKQLRATWRDQRPTGPVRSCRTRLHTSWSRPQPGVWQLPLP